MKSESVVIADQHAAVNTFSGLVQKQIAPFGQLFQKVEILLKISKVFKVK